MSFEWFFKMPGLFITGGVVLIIIAFYDYTQTVLRTIYILLRIADRYCIIVFETTIFRGIIYG